MSLQLKPRATSGPLEGIDRIMGLFFGRKNKPIQGDRLETIIGPSTRFTGDLSVDGGVRIDGQFEGKLEAGGNVVIGEKGRVVADITARHITVGGAVKGNVRATGRLEILKTGHVFGDIHASQVLIDDGGVFQGMGLLGAKDLPALAAPAHDALHPLRDIDPAAVEALQTEADEGAPPEPDDSASASPNRAADASAARPPKAETEEIVDPDLAEMSQSKAQDQPEESAQSSHPTQSKNKADILSPETKKPKRLTSMAAKARKAGGLGRGLDLNPLDGDLEIEPTIPELGDASTSGAKSDPAAKNPKPKPTAAASKKAGSASGKGTNGSVNKSDRNNNNGNNNGKSGSASNSRKNNKRRSSNRNRRRRSSR